MSYLSQSPEVYHYNSQAWKGDIKQIPTPFVAPSKGISFNYNRNTVNNVVNPQPPALNRFGQSQIERVFQPIVQVNPQSAQSIPTLIITNSTLPNNQNPPQIPAQQQVKIPKNTAQSVVDVRVSQDATSTSNRFSTYLLNDKSHKYNLFSTFDEPWNNCLNGKKCGSFPGNECIASTPFARQSK